MPDNSPRYVTDAATRIIFMGTPDFAVPVLRALHESSDEHHWRVVAVATQPDRPSGRGKKLVESPVKQFATEHAIPILQPKGFRKRLQAIEELRSYAPDLYVVAAYGIILPGSALELPAYGSVNVHASILPAYRGASPITAAILNGDAETGVSIMLMDVGMDTGPVLAQTRLRIAPDDTTDSLSQRLAQQGADELISILPQWLAGRLPAVPQDDLPGEPSICRMIKKSDGLIDWRQPAVVIERMTRAYTPWPSAYAIWREQPLKIWQAEALALSGEPGVVFTTESGIAIGAGEGALLLQIVQPAGKRAMEARSFVNGAPDFIGSDLT